MTTMLMMMPLSIANQFLMPVSICVVFPIMIVWLTTRIKENETNRRTEIILAALEKGQDTDLEAIVKQLAPKEEKSNTKWRIMYYLRTGCVLLAIGLGLLAIAGIIKLDGGGFSNKDVLIFSGAGITLFFMGIGFIIVYHTSRRFMAEEIAREEEQAKTDD